MLEQSQVNRFAICQQGVYETDVQIFMPNNKLKTQLHWRKQDRNHASWKCIPITVMYFVKIATSPHENKCIKVYCVLEQNSTNQLKISHNCSIYTVASSPWEIHSSYTLIKVLRCTEYWLSIARWICNAMKATIVARPGKNKGQLYPIQHAWNPPWHRYGIHAISQPQKQIVHLLSPVFCQLSVISCDILSF